MNRLVIQHKVCAQNYSKRHLRRTLKNHVDANIAEINSLRSNELNNNNLNLYVVDQPQYASSSFVSQDVSRPFASQEDSNSLNEPSNSCMDVDSLINLRNVESDLSYEIMNIISSKSENLMSKLRACFFKHNLTHTAINDILKILKFYHNELPVDARTLLLTPRTTIIEDFQNGQYAHFSFKCGLEQKIKSGLKHNLPSIKVIFHIDGLKLYDSSVYQFWPISCKVVDSLNNKPFLIGLYFGKSKPSDVKEYLKYFVEDLNQYREGIEIFGKIYFIHIHAVICDTPARAFVKCTKPYNAYYGCDKCKQKGEWHGRMTFPEINAPRRKDEDILKHDRHFIDVSPFIDLGVPLVSKFPLDYMHLVCLGVMRKLLLIWYKGPNSVRLGRKNILKLNESIENCVNLIPCEFQRKPRSLYDLERWKATELRLFLLYTGPVVLKYVLPNVLYEHFLILHFSIRLIISEKYYVKYSDYSGSLLNYFVENCIKLYGKEFLSYNVHALSHLVDDVKIYGVLDNFSAFAFESFMGHIKRMLRSSPKPLQQVYKRIKELEQMESLVAIQSSHGLLPFSVISSSATKTIRPTLDLGFVGQSYKQAKVLNFIIKCSEGNDHVLMRNGLVVKVENIILNDNKLYIIGKSYTNYCNFYNVPSESSNLEINCVSNFSPHNFWPVDNIVCKGMILHTKKDSVFFPLAHFSFN